MTNGRVLGLVTARGGSKRLPGKNLLDFGGRPLIVHTIDAARACPSIARVVLSTDDPSIADVSRRAGADVPFLRPDALAGDSVSSMDVVFHALDWLAEHENEKPWAVALLQPTSPLRTAAHLTAAIAQLTAQRSPAAVVGVTAARPASWLHTVDPTRRLSAHLKGVSLPSISSGERLVIPNGAIYVATVEHLRAHGGFVSEGTEAFEMKPIDSVDIDTADDFELALACFKSASR